MSAGRLVAHRVSIAPESGQVAGQRFWKRCAHNDARQLPNVNPPCSLTKASTKLHAGPHRILFPVVPERRAIVRNIRIALALVFAAGLSSIAVSADSRNGRLHVTKECSHYTGSAGSYCTITSSNLPAIQVGSKVYYTQAAVGSAAPEANGVSLDSNVVLFVAAGDWAVGRCTLGTTFQGLCTFSDGVGELAGFRARVAVAPTGGANYSWTGTYRFPGDNDR